MAVTVFWLVIFQLLYSHNYAQKSYNDKSKSSLVLSRLSKFQSALSLKMFNCSSRPGATVKRLCSAWFAKTKTASVKWAKRGVTTLAIPGFDPPMEVTVYMDISLNPGPFINLKKDSASMEGTVLHTNQLAKTTTANMQMQSQFAGKYYSRDQLMHF